MEYHYLIAVISCIALTACASLQLGAPQRGVIIGRVAAARDSVPLAGAYVILWGAGSSTITDSAGRFTLPRPQGGLDSITISRDGYAPFTVPALPLGSRDTLRFEASLNSLDERLPGGFRECGFDFPRERDCNSAVSPYDIPVFMIDGVMFMYGPGVAHATTEPPGQFVQAEILRIEVLSGTRAAAFLGQRAWYGVVIVNTVLCPPKPIDPRRPSYSCK